MGNAQSMDKVQNVVSEGMKIYQTVKSQQDQQQHGGGNQQSHYNNNNQQPHYDNNQGQEEGYGQAQQQYNQSHHQSGGHSPNYHPSQDIDDDQEYSGLRQQAHEEAEKRNACYAQSQEAYNNGDGARGW